MYGALCDWFIRLVRVVRSQLLDVIKKSLIESPKRVIKPTLYKFVT